MFIFARTPEKPNERVIYEPFSLMIIIVSIDTYSGVHVLRSVFYRVQTLNLGNHISAARARPEFGVLHLFSIFSATVFQKSRFF